MHRRRRRCVCSVAAVVVVVFVALLRVGTVGAQFSTDDVGGVRECFGVEEVAGCDRYCVRTALRAVETCGGWLDRGCHIHLHTSMRRS